MLKESANQLPQNHPYNGIDLIKFFCAVLVLIIHVPLFNTEYSALNDLNFWLKNYICRVAVPFFFTTSGFLLFKKTEFTNINGDIIKKSCFKNLRLLGTWTFLLFVGGTGHLWYLGALVLAVIVLAIMLKNGIKLQNIIIFALVAFIIGLLGDAYYGVIEPLKDYRILKIFIELYERMFQTTRNGLFFGLIFVLMGALFAQRKIKMNNKVAILGLIVSLVIMFFEVYLLKLFSHPKSHNMLASLVPVIFFLFYIATHLDLKNRPIYSSLRVIGTLVFFSHLLVNSFVEFALKAVKSKIGINLFSFQFLITLTLTIVFSIVIDQLSKKQRFYWLKYLYS